MNEVRMRRIQDEAESLLKMPRQQARALLGDRIARAQLLRGEEQLIRLAENAELCTQIRELASTRSIPDLWSNR